MKTILWATLILLIVTTLPYLWCWWRSPADAEFTGCLSFPDAFNSDMGWMRQVRDGHVLLTNVYDYLPPRHVFFNGFWVPLGLLARASGLSPLLVFHAARWGCSLGLVIVFWLGLRRCVEARTPRQVLLIYFMVGGGFGWLLAGLSWMLLGRPILSYDLWSTFYPFMEMLLSAHVTASHALVLAIAYLWSRGEEQNTVGRFVLAGLAGAFLASFHPYQIPVLWLGLVFYAAATLSTGKRFRRVALSRLPQWMWLVLIPLPVVLYYVWLLHRVEAFGSWRSQATSGPPLWSLPFHLGPLILLALWARKDLREIGKVPLSRVCGALFVSNFLVVHSPISFSWARQTDISLIGLGILFLAPAVGARWQRLQVEGSSKTSKWIALTVLILALGNAPLLVAKRTATAQSAFPFQVPRELLQVFQALDEQSDFNTVVVSDPELGALIPRYAGARSLLGHPDITARYDEKKASYQEALLDPVGPKSRRNDFLRRYDIDYWITTPRSDPAAQDLPLVFEAGDFRLRLVSEQ